MLDHTSGCAEIIYLTQTPNGNKQNFITVKSISDQTHWLSFLENCTNSGEMYKRLVAFLRSLPKPFTKGIQEFFFWRISPKQHPVREHDVLQSQSYEAVCDDVRRRSIWRYSVSAIRRANVLFITNDKKKDKKILKKHFKAAFKETWQWIQSTIPVTLKEPFQNVVHHVDVCPLNI